MTPTTDIYIRTYRNDLPWLVYCLRSIHKFVTGYRKIIVCIPEDQKELLKDFNLENVVTAPIYPDDRIGQQVSKLLSYKHTDAEFILFVDSDVCFSSPVDVSEYFRDGKPIIYETPWELVGDAICWKECTEKILGFIITAERMRRLPILYRNDTLAAIDKKFKVHKFAKFDRLSEFNLVGSYARHYESEKYYFWHTINEPDLPPVKLIQHHSWSGLNQEIIDNMERILG